MADCRSTLSMSKIKVRISETKYCPFTRPCMDETRCSILFSTIPDMPAECECGVVAHSAGSVQCVDWDRISRQWAVAAARLGSTPSNPRCRVTISKRGILQSYRDLSTRRVSAMVTSRPMVLVLMGSRQMVTDPVQEHWSLTHPAQMT